MKATVSLVLLSGLLALAALAGSGCSRRMTVATGTTIGLHATPGDGKSQSPQVTLAYKRAELALVPTAGKAARKNSRTDAYSSLAIIDFQTRWWRDTSIDQFIAAGHASRDIQAPGSAFPRALARSGDVRNNIVEGQIYAALQGAGGAGDTEAAARARDLEALGELVPDQYSYLDIPAAIVRKIDRRPAAANYHTFTTYRARLDGTINVLKSAPTVSVVELDGVTRALTADALKRELKQHEQTRTELQKQVEQRGVTQRALAYYMETLRR